jgi:hypothetical protein
VSLFIQHDILPAIGPLCFQSGELYITANCLCGLIELNAAEPRPNSGPGKTEGDGDYRHHNNDFDESKTAASVHMVKDAGQDEKDELLPIGDIHVVTVPAFLSVGAIREEVEIPMLTGRPVHIRMIPGVGWNIFFEVGTIPVFQ